VLKFRGLLVPLTAIWLSLHLMVGTGMTIMVLLSGSATSDIVCTCAHGADHGSCPMHRAPSDSTRCRLQSTSDDLGLAVRSMLGPLALPATPVREVAEASAPVPKGYDSTLPLDWTVPPEPPPPRT
jgi:hypothetical protein